jgi:hypothetical protein
MNYSSKDFARLCEGYDADIRYKDEFLYYRFLKNPEQKPKQLKPLTLPEKINKKIKAIKQKIKVGFNFIES